MLKGQMRRKCVCPAKPAAEFAKRLDCGAFTAAFSLSRLKNIQHSTFNLQRRRSNIEHQTSNVEPRTLSGKSSSFSSVLKESVSICRARARRTGPGSSMVQFLVFLRVFVSLLFKSAFGVFLPGKGRKEKPLATHYVARG